MDTISPRLALSMYDIRALLCRNERKKNLNVPSAFLVHTMHRPGPRPYSSEVYPPLSAFLVHTMAPTEDTLAVYVLLFCLLGLNAVLFVRFVTHES